MALPDYEDFMAKYMSDRMSGYRQRWNDIAGAFGPNAAPPPAASAAPAANTVTDGMLPIPGADPGAAPPSMPQGSDMSQPRKGGQAGQELGKGIFSMLFA